MNDYLLIFKMDYALRQESTPEQARAMTQRWMEWINGMAAANSLVDRGNRLSPSGKLIKPGNVITNGPFTEIKESIGGYTLIRSRSYDDALEIAKGCPILTVGGSVEVRETDPI